MGLQSAAHLVAADETRKASKKTNDLLEQLLAEQKELVAQQQRTNDLLKYLADMAYAAQNSTAST